MAAVCPAAKAVRHVPFPLLFSFKPHVERYDFRSWQTPPPDLGSPGEEVITGAAHRPNEQKSSPAKPIGARGASLRHRALELHSGASRFDRYCFMIQSSTCLRASSFVMPWRS